MLCVQRETAIEVVRELYQNSSSLLTALEAISSDHSGHALDKTANELVRRPLSRCDLRRVDD